MPQFYASKTKPKEEIECTYEAKLRRSFTQRCKAFKKMNQNKDVSDFKLKKLKENQES